MIQNSFISMKRHSCNSCIAHPSQHVSKTKHCNKIGLKPDESNFCKVGECMCLYDAMLLDQWGSRWGIMISE